MSEPFLGEIQMFGFNFPPRGWAQCDGQLLPISMYSALFALLGTTYGGDGETTFALPDLRGRVPMHFTTGFALGSRAGAEQHVLTAAQIPAHTHVAPVSANDATTATPTAGAMLAKTAAGDWIYRGRDPDVPMGAASTTTVGASQAHQNMQPFRTVTFCIALSGVFPSRS